MFWCSSFICLQLVICSSLKVNSLVGWFLVLFVMLVLQEIHKGSTRGLQSECDPIFHYWRLMACMLWCWEAFVIVVDFCNLCAFCRLRICSLSSWDFTLPSWACWITIVWNIYLLWWLLLLFFLQDFWCDPRHILG
jgi:hypothetical protein